MMRQQMALQAYLNLRAQQRADQQALYLQQQQNMYNLMQSLAAIRPKQLQVNCTSQLVGNFVYTNCR
jgi:Tfp pilus assembly protein PilV